MLCFYLWDLAILTKTDRQSALVQDPSILQILTVHGNEGQSIIPTPHADITAVGTTFNIFSCDVVWVENQINHLPDTEQMYYVLCKGNVKVTM